MRNLAKRSLAWTSLVLALCGFAVASTGTAALAAPQAANSSPAANCPPGLKCQVVLAKLADGGCNWSPANRAYDIPVYGLTIHTTEGTLQQALDEAQSGACISWNYLVAPDGTIIVSVPKDSLAYDAANWYFNMHYGQIELIGRAEDCSTITPAEYVSTILLSRWLIRQFHIAPSPATIIGHDSVPGSSDAVNAAQHWDPGYCWPWTTFLATLGAPIVPTALPGSRVVTIRTLLDQQPLSDCAGPAFTNCVSAAPSATNFVPLYTDANTSAPLVSDPYLHPDGSPGSTAMQDWGDKAVTGHSYVVLGRKPGWTQIQYNGGTAWFQDNHLVSVPTTAQVVTPKGNTPVAVYGRPLPEYNAPGWAAIPYDHQSQVPLTKYLIQPGQYYTIAPVPSPRTDYAEGCNLANCTGSGDTTVVIGTTKYIEISFGHRYAFVDASTVNVVSLN